MSGSKHVLGILLATLIAWPAWGADATTPGEVTTPYPTLINLSVEWAIEGDDDLDGVVTVRYRPIETTGWRDALPLRRVPAGSSQGFSWSNKHSGSILDLQPDTGYEIELTLTDPDGGSGQHTVTAATRPVPQASPSGTERPADPSTVASVASSAQPGDIILLAAGDYDGFTFERDGTLDEPIVIRSVLQGAAVFGGDVRLDGRSHVFLEGLTVHGKIKFNGAEGIVVRRCAVHTTGSGIVSIGDGLINGYIADNVVLGTTDWSESSVGSSGDNHGEGIQFTGPGNVICHNFVRGFRDAISTMEDGEAHNQVSIDIYHNDIEVGADDAIEADFAMGNCRIVRNRITNSNTGLSAQPSLGGPTYFIGNVMYNLTHVPFKLHRGSVGDVVLHNTSVKCGDAFAVYTGDTWSHAWFRNNLFIGGDGPDTCRGSGKVASLDAADGTCDFNFDGYGTIGTGDFRGRIGDDSFSSLAEMQANTTEHDAVELDMDVFSATVAYPSVPFPELPIPDLAILSGSAAADRGVPLANVNDGFDGAAPDLGALEAGREPPHYGPRPEPPDVLLPPLPPTDLVVR